MLGACDPECDRLKGSSDDLAVVGVPLVTYTLLPGCYRKRIGAQVDHGDDALVFWVDLRDQLFVGARDPEASAENTIRAGGLDMLKPPEPEDAGS